MPYWKRSWAYSKRDQCKWHLFSRSLCPSTLAKPTSVQKNTQFWVGVAISKKSFSVDDKIIASNAKAEVFFETFLFSKETWKLPLYPVARKNTQAQLFSTLRIYLNDLIFWEFFWKCSHAISRMLDVPIFLRTTQMVFGGMLVRYIVPFFQFDRNYAWSQHYFAKYIYLAFFIWHTHLLSHVKTCFIRKLYNLIRALVVAS